MLKTVQQKKYVCGLSGRAVASFAHYLVNKNIVKLDINIACLVINCCLHENISSATKTKS